jgi:hypothetical protein
MSRRQRLRKEDSALLNPNSTEEQVSIPPPPPPSDMQTYIAERRAQIAEREQVGRDESADRAELAERSSEESPQQKYMSARREQIESAKGDRNEPWTPAMQAAFDRRVQRKLAQIEKEKGESREPAAKTPESLAPAKANDEAPRHQAGPTREPTHDVQLRLVVRQERVAKHHAKYKQEKFPDAEEVY